QLQFAEDLARVLSGANTTHGAVADDGGGLVVPFGVHALERALERGGHRAVVFGSEEDESVEFGDLVRPSVCRVAKVVACSGREWLFEHGELEVVQVYEFEFDAVCLGVVFDPLADLDAVTAGTGAANDDANLEV